MRTVYGKPGLTTTFTLFCHLPFFGLVLFSLKKTRRLLNDIQYVSPHFRDEGRSLPEVHSTSNFHWKQTVIILPFCFESKVQGTFPQSGKKREYFSFFFIYLFSSLFLRDPGQGTVRRVMRDYRLLLGYFSRTGRTGPPVVGVDGGMDSRLVQSWSTSVGFGVLSLPCRLKVSRQ